jgi:hypothetical protein
MPSPYEPPLPPFVYEVPAVTAPERGKRWLRATIAGIIVAVVVAGLGAPLGWLWATLAPRLAVIKADNGYLYAEATPEQPIAEDGWFAILGAGAGLVLAVLAWYLIRRYRGVAVIVGLTLGSLAGAAIAWWVGYKIGVSQFNAVKDTAAIGAQLNAPLGLRVTDLSKDKPWLPLTTGVAAVQALVAAAVYTGFAGFSASPDLDSQPPAPTYYPYAPPLPPPSDTAWTPQPSPPPTDALPYPPPPTDAPPPALPSPPDRTD